MSKPSKHDMRMYMHEVDRRIWVCTREIIFCRAPSLLIQGRRSLERLEPHRIVLRRQSVV